MVLVLVSTHKTHLINSHPQKPPPHYTTRKHAPMLMTRVLPLPSWSSLGKSTSAWPATCLNLGWALSLGLTKCSISAMLFIVVVGELVGWLGRGKRRKRTTSTSSHAFLRCNRAHIPHTHQNSRTRRRPARGEISLRNPRPICAAAKGILLPLKSRSRRKLTKRPYNILVLGGLWGLKHRIARSNRCRSVHVYYLCAPFQKTWRRFTFLVSTDQSSVSYHIMSVFTCAVSGRRYPTAVPSGPMDVCCLVGWFVLLL